MKRKNTEEVHDTISERSSEIMKIVMDFLMLFMPEILAKRLICVILLCAQVESSRIIELSGYCERSVRNVKSKLKSENFSDIFTLGHGGRKCKLQDYAHEIEEELDSHNYQTRQQIVDMIYEKFNLKVSTSAISRFLAKHGYKILKCGSYPAKADVKLQRSYYEDVLQPLMQKAKNNEIVLLFMDASHFVFGCEYLGRVYTKARRYFKTYSGRNRYNVLGAIDYVTKKVFTVTDDKYIKSDHIIALLSEIKFAYESEGKTIHIVLDNARYQRCKRVQEVAEGIGIKLQFIPPYSPNLNLIERLWKYVKAELRIKYFDNFDAFKDKIDSILEMTSTKDREKIDSLINEKVQLFDDLIPIDQSTLEVPHKPQNVLL